MKDLKGKEVIIVVLISVMALILAYGLLYIPKSREIIKLQKEATKIYNEIESVEKMINRVPNPKKEIELLQERLQRLKEKATDKEQLPKIIQQLFRKTGELNIEVISIKPHDYVEEKGSSNLPEGVSKAYIEVNIRCPYRALVNYIEALNSLPLLFTIENLSIEKPGLDISEVLSVNLLLSTYVMA